MPSPPSTGRVTSPYGPRNGSEIGPGVGLFHYGEDTDGDGNFAPVSGQIVFAGYAGNFGNAILIRDGNAVWGIAHHKSLNGRRVGQNVVERERLAPIGATGLAFGVHAHTERRTGGGNTIQSGAHSNPRLYYNQSAGGSSAPFDEWEQFMVTNQQKLDQIHAALVQPTPDGGAYFKTDAIIGIQRGETNAAIAAVAAGGILFPGAQYPMATAIVNAIRAQGDKPVNVDVDEVALAVELAPALAPLIIENLGTLNDSTIEQLATRVADERDRRERERLGVT